MKKAMVLILALCCYSPAIVNAAPVDLPTAAKEMEGAVFSEDERTACVSLAAEADLVYERKLEKASSEIEGNFYQAKVVFSFDNKMDIYGILGEGHDMQYKAEVAGSHVEYVLEDELTWGGGLNGVLFESYRYGFQIFGDVKYRRTRDIEYNSMSVDGTKYSAAQLTEPKADADWDEWQVALGLIKNFEYIKPYAGVKYSNVDVSAGATAGGTTYDLGATSGDKQAGIFIGCSIVPAKQFSLDIEGRFVDEGALTVSAMYKF